MSKETQMYHDARVQRYFRWTVKLDQQKRVFHMYLVSFPLKFATVRINFVVSVGEPNWFPTKWWPTPGWWNISASIYINTWAVDLWRSRGMFVCHFLVPKNVVFASSTQMDHHTLYRYEKWMDLPTVVFFEVSLSWGATMMGLGWMHWRCWEVSQQHEFRSFTPRTRKPCQRGEEGVEKGIRCGCPSYCGVFWFYLFFGWG